MKQATVPPDMLAGLRKICLALPETREEAAWVGTRWRIRKETFAHVLVIDAGRPAAYAKVVPTQGPACVMTFRSPLPGLNAYAFSESPFFKPGWWPDIVGLALDAHTDWDEVAGLVNESYCRLAPKKLVAALRQRPG